jgi:hypothetical protein
MTPYPAHDDPSDFDPVRLALESFAEFIEPPCQEHCRPEDWYLRPDGTPYCRTCTESPSKDPEEVSPRQGNGAIPITVSMALSGGDPSAGARLPFDRQPVTIGPEPDDGPDRLADAALHVGERRAGEAEAPRANARFMAAPVATAFRHSSLFVRGRT